MSSDSLKHESSWGSQFVLCGGWWPSPRVSTLQQGSKACVCTGWAPWFLVPIRLGRYHFSKHPGWKKFWHTLIQLRSLSYTSRWKWKSCFQRRLRWIGKENNSSSFLLSCLCCHGIGVIWYRCRGKGKPADQRCSLRNKEGKHYRHLLLKWTLSSVDYEKI